MKSKSAGMDESETVKELRTKALELSLEKPIWIVDGLLHLFYSEVEAMTDFHQLIRFGLATETKVTKYYQGQGWTVACFLG